MTNCRSFTRALLGATALAAAALPAPAAAQRIDQIVAFGDSYADEGNFWELVGMTPPAPYSTGRFSGGTNYIDTLSLLLNAPVDNFAIGGALTDNTNTNGPPLGFVTEWNAFLAGGGGAFPTVEGTFDEDDLLAVSIGGNDARFYQQNGGTLAGAPAAATSSAAFATAGLDALVDAGAQNISFLAGNTAILPEVADDPAAQEIRNAYSTTFNAAIQDSLAGYAADGVMVHFLDLSLVAERVMADPEAYGLSAVACPPLPDTSCILNSQFANQHLIYFDQLHLTSAGFAIVARYVATQLQAPLTLQATSDLGLDTARQFGRTLSSRVDLAAPRDGDLAEGMRFFIVGDTLSRDVEADRGTDEFDIDSVGVTAGVTYGFGTSIVGLAANYSRPQARFGAGVAETETDSWQIGAFGGYTLGPLFAQAYAGYGRDDHEIERAGVIDSLTADTDGDHMLAGLKGGYLMPVGIMRAGPVVALDYARAEVEGYTESGDAALALNVDDVSARSLTGGIGAELRGDFDGGGVQLRPFASAMLEADLLGDARTIRFAQTASPGIVNSWQLEDRSTDPYGRFAVGGSAEILRGASLNALLSTTVGKDQGDEATAHVGLRLGF